MATVYVGSGDDIGVTVSRPSPRREYECAHSETKVEQSDRARLSFPPFPGKPGKSQGVFFVAQGNQQRTELNSDELFEFQIRKSTFSNRLIKARESSRNLFSHWKESSDVRTNKSIGI